MSGWQQRAIELYKSGLGSVKIAEELGRSHGSVRSYLYRWRKANGMVLAGVKEGKEEKGPSISDHGEYYIVQTELRRVEITKADLYLLKQLYCEQKMTINAVCRELDIPRQDFILIKTAFGITKDDVPYLDEDLEGDIDQLVEESLERKKHQYFVKLQQKEVEHALKELEQYRKQDYQLQKIHELVSNHEWNIPRVSPIKRVRSGLMLEVPIVDLHLSKLAWEPETGENYDSKIAERRFMDVISDIVDRAQNYAFEQIVFPVGNDFFNFNDIYGNTTQGTQQDHDSRWQKMYMKGNELLIAAIDTLSQIAPVQVFQIPGNHDTQVSWYAVFNLASWYRHNENVRVDTRPNARKYVEFGKCLIGFTHGDKERKRIFGNMQIEAPEAWGRTLFREWHLGHLHSEQVKEEHGVKVRNLSSVTATDSWHYTSGYVGAIATSQSFVWDKERGLREIWYSPVRVDPS